MDDTQQILNEARHEIVSLRRANELHTAQLAIVEIFAAALGLKRQELGAAPDVVWVIERKLKEMQEPKESESQ